MYAKLRCLKFQILKPNKLSFVKIVNMFFLLDLFGFALTVYLIYVMNVQTSINV